MRRSRHKAILTAAAVAAGVIGALAQSNLYSVGIYASGTAHWDYCSFKFPFPPFDFKLSGREWYEDEQGFVIMDPWRVKENGGILHRLLDVDCGKASFTLSITPDPSDFESLRAQGDHSVIGVVMESGYPTNPITLTAVVDGSAGLYSTNGGRMIRGGQNLECKSAVVALTGKASELRSACVIVDKYPLPKPGNTRIYIITPMEVLSAEVEDHTLESGGHRLSPIYQEAKNLITEMNTAKRNMKLEPGALFDGTKPKSER